MRILKSRNEWVTLVAAAALLGGCATNPAPVVDHSLGNQSAQTSTTGASTQPLASTNTGVEHANGEVTTQGYRVARGDTLYSIAFKHGMDFRALAMRNNIPPPYTIHPGQMLRLGNGSAMTNTAPATTTTVTTTRQVAATNAPAANNTQNNAPVFGPVQANPSAGTAPVAQTSNTENGTTTLPQINLQPSRAPNAPVMTTQTTRTVATNPNQPNASSTTTVTTTTSTPVNTTQQVTQVGAPLSSAAAGRTRNVDGVTWQWPADGAVISGSGAGLDIAGNAGDPVRAAADGVVVYSGNGLIGYGELIIIKHSDNYLSAYGHNSKRLVQEGQHVRAGQQIAEMGSTGAPREELHFEIRKAGKPVDPTGYLPER